VVELAEEIFQMPVRLGSPHDIRGLTDIVTNPIHSTGVGLLMHGLAQQQSGGKSVNRKQEEKESVLVQWFNQLKSWFQGNL
jgi:cell division protein FtsA